MAASSPGRELVVAVPVSRSTQEDFDAARRLIGLADLRRDLKYSIKLANLDGWIIRRRASGALFMMYVAADRSGPAGWIVGVDLVCAGECVLAFQHEEAFDVVGQVDEADLGACTGNADGERHAANI